MGRMDPYKTSSGANVAGGFFGQSSFSKFAIASESSVVNVEGLVRGKEELKVFAPLGCGLQTGAASVMNRALAKKGDSVAVIGLGGVGMAAIMVGFLHQEIDIHANILDRQQS
jgi:Zn-dependent alcohol dehydrogenase